MARYQWEDRAESPHMNTVHVDFPISLDGQTISDLKAVRGIERVHVDDDDRYSLTFSKGRLFVWGEIRPLVIDVLQRSFPLHAPFIESKEDKHA